MNAKILTAILVLALASVACSINIDLPNQPTPGPEVTDQISVPVPGAGTTRLELDFSAGDLTISPGAGAELVRGTATYNLPALRPEITTSGVDVRIKQGDFEIDSLPSYRGLVNKWNLQLGDSPLDLTVGAGAYEAEYELGGLSLSSLYIKDGAADVKLAFSSPNRIEMGVLRYETGASKVDLEGLANANFHTLVFDSGAGDYLLDFSGDLKRDATITIRSGLSNIVLRIPNTVNATVMVDSGLSNVSSSGSWDKSGDRYMQVGSGPSLTFVVDMGAGLLKLTD